jgi:transcriptional regulator with XRE-family HTH domain
MDKQVEADRMSDGLPLGIRLKTARVRARMTLKVLAEKTDLSESFLSQLERDRVNASLASLQRITRALGTNVAALFDESRTSGIRLVRKSERSALTFGVYGRKFLLTPTPLENLEVFVGEFEVGGTTGTEPYSHGDSDEMFIVWAGTFELQVGSERFTLSEGDCVSYRSSLPHKAVNVGSARGEVMWIISPPSY